MYMYIRNTPNSLSNVLEEYGIPLSKVKKCKNYRLIKAGCELLYLSKEDVLYLMDDSISDVAATNRLKERRISQPI